MRLRWDPLSVTEKRLCDTIYPHFTPKAFVEHRSRSETSPQIYIHDPEDSSGPASCKSDTLASLHVILIGRPLAKRMIQCDISLTEFTTIVCFKNLVLLLLH